MSTPTNGNHFRQNSVSRHPHDGSSSSSPKPQNPPQRASSGSRRGYSSSAAEEPQNPSSNSSRSKKSIGDYRLTKTLGQGSMGKVKLAIHSVTGEKFACKIIPRPPGLQPVEAMIGPTSSVRNLPAANEVVLVQPKKTDDTKETRIIREAAIMLLLQHPHIVKLHEIVLQDNHYYFFFELVNGGQMLDYIISHGRLKEKHARKFIRQIVSAVDYCHKNNIVHRDLKIENVLIDKSGNIKLIDFGLSNLYSKKSFLSTFCGSLYFAAPELLNAKAYIGPEVDIWSLGIILYVLVCGKVPFDDTSMAMLHAKIKAGVVEYPSHLSSDCKNLISRMLTTKPTLRASMSEIQQHPWMNKGYDGPPNNYLPPRPPLEHPLDMEVIKRMKGFDFGKEEDLYKELEAFVTYSAHDSTLDNFQLPIVSIYYLVREKMIRDSRPKVYKEPGADLSSTSLSSQGYLQIEANTPMVGSLPTSPGKLLRSATDPSVQIIPTRRQRAQTMTSQDPEFKTITENGNSNADFTGKLFSKSESVPSPIQTTFQSEEQPGRGIRGKLSQVFRNARSRSQSTAVPHANIFKRSSEPRKSGDGDFLSMIKGRSDSPPSPPASPTRGRQHDDSRKSDGFIASARKSLDKRQQREYQQKLLQANQDQYGKQEQMTQHVAQGSMIQKMHPDHMMTSYNAEQVLHHKNSQQFQPNIRYQPQDLYPKNMNPHQQQPPPQQHQQPQQQQMHTHPSQYQENLYPSTRTDFPQQNIAANLFPQPPHNHVSSSPQQFDSAVKLHRSKSNGNAASLNYLEKGTSNSIPALSGKSGRADDHIRSVHLKGLFSVVNTSTKSPSAIRKDLLRVFKNLEVEVHEYYGGFECFFEGLPEQQLHFGQQPELGFQEPQYNGMSSPVPQSRDGTPQPASLRGFFTRKNTTTSPPPSPNASYANGFAGNNNPLMISTAINSISTSGTASPLSPRNGNERRSGRGRAESMILQPPTANYYENLGSNTPTNAAPTNAVAQIPQMRGHAQQKSVSSVLGYNSDPDSPFNGIDGVIQVGDGLEGSQGLGSKVRFEVYIVKIPWLGLHGVQFRKVTGDTWQYKRICTEILNQIRL
ncbi:serine/threonine-protein kinase KIN2 [Nowakowskiella sp. JEL0407]|nr:serine/threonine-protein kinase KIN2 [Nowakowskiella sp. JEL0407]